MRIIKFHKIKPRKSTNGIISEYEQTPIRSKHMSFERAHRAESNGKKFLCGLNSEPRYSTLNFAKEKRGVSSFLKRN